MSSVLGKNHNTVDVNVRSVRMNNKDTNVIFSTSERIQNIMGYSQCVLMERKIFRRYLERVCRRGKN